MGRKKKNAATRADASTEAEVEDDFAAEALQEQELEDGGADARGRLQACQDGLLEQRAATREQAATELARLLAYCAADAEDELRAASRSVTKLLCGCLRHGKPREGCLAARGLALVVAVVGPDDGAAVLADARPRLERAISDATEAPATAGAALEALAICTFVAAAEEPEAVCAVWASAALLLGDARPVPARAALRATALLATVLDDDELRDRFDDAVQACDELLLRPDSETRGLAGTLCAVLATSEGTADLTMPDTVDARLHELALGSDAGVRHHTARDVLKRQRSHFRNVEAAVATGDEGEPEELTIEGAHLEFATWTDRVRLQMFRRLLGGGLQSHLARNHLLRDVFELGDPDLQVNAHGVEVERQAEGEYKLSAQEKRMLRGKGSSKAKARDKSRSSRRDDLDRERGGAFFGCGDE